MTLIDFYADREQMLTDTNKELVNKIKTELMKYIERDKYTFYNLGIKDYNTHMDIFVSFEFFDGYRVTEKFHWETDGELEYVVNSIGTYAKNVYSLRKEYPLESKINDYIQHNRIIHKKEPGLDLDIELLDYRFRLPNCYNDNLCINYTNQGVNEVFDMKERYKERIDDICEQLLDVITDLRNFKNNIP